jgi:hypothetical protein
MDGSALPACAMPGTGSENSLEWHRARAEQLRKNGFTKMDAAGQLRRPILLPLPLPFLG